MEIVEAGPSNLDERLDELTERVTQTEALFARQGASARKRLSEYGGLVALALSITLGKL